MEGEFGFCEGDREDELELGLSLGKKKGTCTRAPPPSSDALHGTTLVSTTPQRRAVVGWPPVMASRKRCIITNKNRSKRSCDNILCRGACEQKNEEERGGPSRKSLLVKVYMDGDPIGRKLDLEAHCSYDKLASTLESMFQPPSMTLSAAKLLDGTSELSLTYRDGDGDWMLVADVPWGTFVSSVKRLRIMRTFNTKGIACTKKQTYQPSSIMKG